ncbi:MAG: EAL domain-containing protein [Pseudomonadota bacterium]|nr:EAL domain-containing protein [Pseudomonadota bacterium]
MKRLVIGSGALLLAEPAWAGSVRETLSEPASIAWVITAAALVLMMQAGFMMLEAGLVRSKNSINVAQKNLLDFVFAALAFAIVGFMIAFGRDGGYGFGLDADSFLLSNLDPSGIAFFAFQVMFCGTAATILSGATAERLRLSVYVIASVVVGALIYPVFAHWAWGNVLDPSASAFLANRHFVDFAGSTVVHATGAWVSLAGCLVLGPRIGRFGADGRPNRIAGHSTVIATAGTLLIFFGWLGFNGGSTFEANAAVGGIVANTVLAGAAGGAVGYLLCLRGDGVTYPEFTMYGLLGGLVAITAGCHLLTPGGAILIGALGGGAAIGTNAFIERRFRIDDALGVIGIHGVAGVVGTIGLAFVAPLERLPAGSRLDQFDIQAIGSLVNFIWVFCASYILFRVLDAIRPIRVSAADEERGLNQTEHASAIGLGGMEQTLERIVHGTADLGARLPVLVGEETERLTRLFNSFLDNLETNELQHRSLEEARRASQEAERLATLADAASEGILLLAEGRIRDANPAAQRLLRIDASPEFHPHIMEFVASADRSRFADALQTIADEPFQIEMQCEGAAFPVEVKLKSIMFRGMQMMIVALTDLSARLAAEERIRFIALHDGLTGLPNRMLFGQTLDETLAGLRDDGPLSALLLIDLDRFKAINDLYGHPAGDALLAAVSARLKQAVGSKGLAARCGGDEFAIILRDISFANQATDFAMRLLQSLREPVDLGNGVRINPGASIGVAILPRDGRESSIVTSRADTALYYAKRQGRNTYKVFAPGMDAEEQTRLELEEGLAHAIARDELLVLYQPRIDLFQRSVVSYEALIRWRHPSRGLISPATFIPIAEQSGRIAEIGEWVMRQACRQAVASFGEASVSVNVSALQFRAKGFVETVMRILDETGLRPERLEIELTESALVDDRDQALGILRHLKKLGVRVSLDDFGTGYSSLSYLRVFPFDALKIDRSFVRDIETGDGSLAILEAVLRLGRAMRLRVVAEGVETDAQLAILQGLRCDEVQGYLFSKPVEPEALANFDPATVFDTGRSVGPSRAA